jgi:hypothetical protein
MALRPITDEEGSKGGARSILTFAVVAAALTVLLFLVGVSGRKVTPEAPKPSTESPATSGSPNP